MKGMIRQPMAKGMRQPHSEILLRHQDLLRKSRIKRRDDDGHLLAGRLPADVKALAARGGHFRQIDGDTAQFDTPPKSPARGGPPAPAAVRRCRWWHSQVRRRSAPCPWPSAPAWTISPCAARCGRYTARASTRRWPHHEARSEAEEGGHQRDEFILVRKKVWRYGLHRCRTERSRTSRGNCRWSRGTLS